MAKNDLLNGKTRVDSPLKKSILQKPVLFPRTFVGVTRRYAGISPAFRLLATQKNASVFATKHFFNGLLSKAGGRPSVCLTRTSDIGLCILATRRPQ